MSLSSLKFLCWPCWTPKDMRITERIIAVQGQSRVADFGTNPKRVCDFLLVINSNPGPILHRFRATVVYWSKNSQNCQFRTHPSLRNCPRSGWPLSNFVMIQIFPETRMIRLSEGEEIMTLSSFWYNTGVWRTDRQTFLLWLYQRNIACYANALVMKEIRIHKKAQQSWQSSALAMHLPLAR